MNIQTEAKLSKTKELDRKEYQFDVILERYPDGRYYIYCPSLKGCRTWGHSEEEALQYMQEAIELYIDDLNSGETILSGMLHDLIDDAGWSEDDLIRLKLMKKG